MTALRAQTLALGHSGVRPRVIELLVQLLDHGVHACIPRRAQLVRQVTWLRWLISRYSLSAKARLSTRGGWQGGGS